MRYFRGMLFYGLAFARLDDMFIQLVYNFYFFEDRFFGSPQFFLKLPSGSPIPHYALKSQGGATVDEGSFAPNSCKFTLTTGIQNSNFFIPYSVGPQLQYRSHTLPIFRGNVIL